MESIPSYGIGTAHITEELDFSDFQEFARKSPQTPPPVLHIDTAKVYGTERLVGASLQRAFSRGDLTARNQVWVTSKVWNDDHLHVEEACRASLERLQLAQLDLYLIHWPQAWRKGTILCPEPRATLEDTWRQMERLVDLGLVRFIGVANFDQSHLARILRVCRIRPFANQLEIHPLLSQEDLVLYNQRLGIHVIAWSPLAKCNDALMRNSRLQQLAEAKGKTIPQIVLRWHIQRGIAVIPRSSRPERRRENMEIFDFELSENEMNVISGLNTNSRLTRDWIGVFDSTPDFPYRFPIRPIVFAIFRLVFLFIPKIDLQGIPWRTK